MEFIDRDRNIAATADAVLGGIEGEEAKAAAALAWTRANVRNAPSGLPIIDDHIWHIIIRGYGEADQRSDVFTTLLAYAGVRAYWTFIGTKPEEIPISYASIRRSLARVRRRAAGWSFATPRAQLATPDELAGDHDLIRAAAAIVVVMTRRLSGVVRRVCSAAPARCRPRRLADAGPAAVVRNPKTVGDAGPRVADASGDGSHPSRRYNREQEFCDDRRGRLRGAAPPARRSRTRAIAWSPPSIRTTRSACSIATAFDVRFFTEIERFDRHLEKLRRGPEAERVALRQHLLAELPARRAHPAGAADRAPTRSARSRW